MINIRKLFLESLESVLEDKTSMIKKLVLPDIEDVSEKEAYKQELISFFKSHSNFENKIDWNKFKTLTKKDFDGLIASADRTKGAEKRKEKAEIDSDIKNIFKSQKGREFEVVGENDNWLFVAPLTYEAAIYCDSSENQGAGAKWCIGYEKTDEYWNSYIDDGSVFVMAFNKNYKNMNKEDLKKKLKYMIQADPNQDDYVVWNQADKDSKSLGAFKLKDAEFLDEMFEKAEKVLEVEIEENIEKKIENLKNVDEIDEDYFTKKEKSLLTEIEIPDGVTYIGFEAFYGCNSLTSVTIPNSVLNILYGAFKNCEKLKSIEIPKRFKKQMKKIFDKVDPSKVKITYI